MKAGFHWICEVARCCEKKYVRKRLPGRPFTITGQQCCVCHQPLAFTPTRKRGREWERGWYHERRKKHLAGGLTAHGTPKVRFRLPPLEAAWRAERAGIGVKSAEFLSPLEREAA